MINLIKRAGRRFFAPWRRRSWEGAAINRLTNDWITSILSASEEVKGGLRMMRKRSRELAQDNDYVKRYLSLLKKNVVGHNGIRLQVRATDPKGGMDTFANNEIEDAWKDWGRIGTCTCDGKKSWKDVTNLCLTTMARDGEFLLRMVKGFKNKYSFALQVIDPDLLDIELNKTPLGNGNTTRMGIEVDQWNRPVAYYLLTSHPGDLVYHGRRYNRVPADQIIHGYIEDREGQVRGVPWVHSAMMRLHLLHGYEEAEVVAARVASCKMGFYEQAENYIGDDEGSDGNPIQEADPGHFERLPTGTKFSSFDPQHPTTSFSPAVKTFLRGSASGLDVSYNKLANDLEGVNFSSLREGSIDERDMWMVLQSFVVEHLCQPVFEDWLEMYLLSGLSTLPYSKMDKFHADTWQPRRWMWVDPLKDAKAQEIAADRGWKSDMQIAAEYGNDLEDVYRENQKARQLRSRYSDGEPQVSKGAE